MLLEYFERMRKEPPEVRRRAVATWTVGAVVVAIVIYIVYHAVVLPVLESPENSDTLAAPYEARP